MVLTAGTATFENGSNMVTFSGDALLETNNVQVGYGLRKRGEAAVYEIISVDDEDQVHISPDYAGISAADADYVITNSFTQYLNLDRPTTGEPDIPRRMTENFDKIDAGSLAAILSSLGAIPYASAANVPAALALGLANQKLFVNSGATGLQWDSGFKMGSFTRDTSLASGTQAVTGVGFKPSLLLFLAGFTSSSVQASLGVDDGTNHYAIASNYAITAGEWVLKTDVSIAAVQGVGNNCGGYVSALGADGFTVSWTKTGSKTGTLTLMYLAIR